jgi:drug/metabolite transporter (DMT)-like permease
MLLALAAIWGASFMFIKVGVRELEPATLIWGRVGLAALVLLPLAVRFRNELRRAWRRLFVVAVLNSVVPFWLLSWSEKRLDSGLAAIIQASAPIFTALLALRFVHEERSVGLRLAGLVLGFVGVALLVGVQPRGDVVAALAVVGTALCYAAASLYAGRRLAGVPPMAVAAGTMAAATLLAAPAGAAQLPDHVPGWKVIGSVAALGIGGSAVAYLLYFGIISGAGASRAILVTYLVPPMAVFYGAVFLGEAVRASALGGLALILGGVALGSGTVRLGRPSAARVAAPESGSESP